MLIVSELILKVVKEEDRYISYRDLQLCLFCVQLQHKNQYKI